MARVRRRGDTPRPLLRRLPRPTCRLLGYPLVSRRSIAASQRPRVAEKALKLETRKLLSTCPLCAAETKTARFVVAARGALRPAAAGPTANLNVLAPNPCARVCPAVPPRPQPHTHTAAGECVESASAASAACSAAPKADDTPRGQRRAPEPEQSEQLARV